MAEMTSLQLMIVELAKSGISSSSLKSAVLSVHPHLNDGAYLGNWPPCKSKAGLLVKRRRALGFTSFIDDVVADRVPEYSPEFAEMIVAADCGNWTELDPDELIAQLDEMLRKANARRSEKRSVGFTELRCCLRADNAQNNGVTTLQSPSGYLKNGVTALQLGLLLR